MGQLVFQATLGGQVNLVGPNTASTFNLNVPAVSSTIATLTGTETFTNKTLTSPTLTTPVLGTPSSGTLTNCTGLPNSGLVNSSVTIGGTAIALGASSSTITNDLSISGLTVGKGGSAVVTNTAIGANALNANTTGNTNTAVGFNSLVANTTGTENTGIGVGALETNTTGAQNTGIGREALDKNTTANGNTAVGYRASYSNTTGTQNASVGQQSLNGNTTGSSNSAFGYQALLSNTTASNNTAVGYQAGYNKTTGGSNTFLGFYAGGGITTGNNNLCVGQSAGGVLTTGASNIYIGSGSNTASSAAADSEILICTGNQTGKGNSTGFISPNGGGVYQGNNSAAWSIASDRRLKKNIVDNTEGLDIISQIRVRNFEYRTAEEVTELPANQVIDKQGVQLGVIAQELLEVCGDCVKTESTGVMSVNQDNITWHMVNAIKDLKALVDAQAARIATLEAR